MPHAGHALTLVVLLLGSVTLFVAVPLAEAHVPLVGGGERAIDASRSWAFYEDLEPGTQDVWTFHVEMGDPLFLVIGTPARASWTPVVTLEGPSGPIALQRVDAVSLEPFTPYASRESWSLDTPAPAAGEYVLHIGGDGGAYVLGFGLRESFTPQEWLLIPWQALLIHAWQGQPPWLLVLPYALALSIALLHRAVRNAAPPMLSRVAAALMFASGLERTAQLLFAVSQGARGPAWGFAVAAVLAAIPVALAWATWRSRSPLALIAIAFAAAITWAGLIIGPALALLAGIVAAMRKRGLLRHGVTP